MAGQTIAEKVMSRQNVTGELVTAGDLIDARVDGLMITSYHAVRTACRRIGFADVPPVVFDPARVYPMNDRVQLPRTHEMARANFDSKRDAARLGLEHFYYSEPGLCHQMMLDYGHVRPGELVVANDSHTVSHGAINAVSTGIGNDEATYVRAPPDPDATYAQDIEIDCDAFDFQVAKPFRSDNVGPVDDVVGTKIDQARIGSCANGRFEDIEVAARMLAGRHVSRNVRSYVSPASLSVYKQCADAGLVGLSTFALPGIAALVDEGDEIEVDYPAGVVRNATHETPLPLPRLPASVEEIYEAGGLAHVIAQRLAAQGIVPPAVAVAS
jgi:homoaconitase/3-isopropylmalate dehydratase large subunit